MLPLLLLFTLVGFVEVQSSYPDGSVKERWTWDGVKADENLTKKEWYFLNGQLSRIEEYAGGKLHGTAATWDPDGNPLTETHYQHGVLHGAKVEWRGDEGRQWEAFRLNYQAGKPHGEQTLRYDAERIARKHRYSRGVLDGPQMGWHSNGALQYEMNFVAGVPEGAQRVFLASSAEPTREMHFVGGLAHGTRTVGTQINEEWVEGRHESVVEWHVEGEVPARARVYTCALLPPDVHDEAQDHTRPLKLEIDKTLVAERSWWPNGQLATEQLLEEPFSYTAYAESGRRILQGTGDPEERTGEWKAWTPDGNLVREETWTDVRQGEVQIFDTQGRLREREVWLYDRREWHVVIYEGEVKRAEGELSPKGSAFPAGEWTWYRDGEVWRTALYGASTTPGHRPVVLDSEEFAADGSVRCFGPEEELTCREALEGGTAILTVRALQRPPEGFEVYDPGSMSFQALPPPMPELSQDALLVEVLGGKGVVTARSVRNAEGAVVLEETRHADGALATVRGLDRGTLLYTETWQGGALRTAEDAHPDGGLCKVSAVNGVLEFALYQDEDGDELAWGASRKADRRILDCPTWDRHPELRPLPD